MFITGLHRSGTSLLFKVLKEHGEISGHENTGMPEDEGQHIQSVFKSAAHYGGPGKFCFNKNAHLIESDKTINEKNRIKLFDEWSKYWDLEKMFYSRNLLQLLLGQDIFKKCFPTHFSFFY